MKTATDNTDKFCPNLMPTLIGSLPLADHKAAIDQVIAFTPQIPGWAQLPRFNEEGMMAQFIQGMPALVEEADQRYIDIRDEVFDEALLEFYEDYLVASENAEVEEPLRFRLAPDRAKGFFMLIKWLENLTYEPLAVKCQVTGPITFTTGIKDHKGRAIYYDEQVRDAAVKLLALKATWQVRQLSRFGRPVLLFMDEPALAGFGTSEFISMSRDDVLVCLEEISQAVHNQGAFVGIHVCANTDWSLVVESSVDIVNFDANAYFDKFMLYADAVKAFFDAGRILAWGIVPTLDVKAIRAASVDSLVKDWKAKANKIVALGINIEKICAQSIITPSCGVGSLSDEDSLRVLELTRGVSETLRAEYFASPV